MNSVLANAILAFLESEKGGTLMDLRRFLVEKEFREEHLRTVIDPHIAYYWQKEYPLLKSTSIGPILTRFDKSSYDRSPSATWLLRGGDWILKESLTPKRYY